MHTKSLSDAMTSLLLSDAMTSLLLSDAMTSLLLSDAMTSLLNLFCNWIKAVVSGQN